MGPSHLNAIYHSNVACEWHKSEIFECSGTENELQINQMGQIYYACWRLSDSNLNLRLVCSFFVMFQLSYYFCLCLNFVCLFCVNSISTIFFYFFQKKKKKKKKKKK